MYCTDVNASKQKQLLESITIKGDSFKRTITRQVSVYSAQYRIQMLPIIVLFIIRQPFVFAQHSSDLSPYMLLTAALMIELPSAPVARLDTSSNVRLR